jgi:glycosyltransferase involved in cell wall biosynthesis
MTQANLSSERPLLTIAIPTYNRNASLARTVAVLIPQVSAACKLLILDNLSDIPVSETLAQILAVADMRHIRIIRHNVNIGASANILRCIEECDTPWIWIVNDKCLPRPGAVKTILSSVKDTPEAVYFQFNGEDDYSTSHRSVTEVTTGRLDFVKNIWLFSQLMDINTGVYNVHRIQPFVRYGYIYSFTLVPHVATLLMALDNKAVSVLSKEYIVTRQFTPFQDRPSRLQFATGFPTLLQLQLTKDERTALWRKMKNSMPSAKYCIIVCMMASASGDSNASYQLRCYFQMIQLNDRSLKTKIMRCIAAILMLDAAHCLHVLRIAARLFFGRDLDDVRDVDRFARI